MMMEPVRNDKNLLMKESIYYFSTVPNQLRVRMGEWNAAGDTEPLPAQEFVVSRIFLHPSFNPNNLMNDVAVLRLAVAVPLVPFCYIIFCRKRISSIDFLIIISLHYSRIRMNRFMFLRLKAFFIHDI